MVGAREVDAQTSNNTNDNTTRVTAVVLLNPATSIRLTMGPNKYENTRAIRT